MYREYKFYYFYIRRNILIDQKCPQFIFYRILQHAFVGLNGKHNLNAIIRTSFRHMASGRTFDSLRSHPPRGTSVLLERKSRGRARARTEYLAEYVLRPGLGLVCVAEGT